MENVKDTKEAKTRVVLINQIIDRAAELGIMYSSRLSHSMDINYAVQVFDIDLKAWLDSTNNDFIHDYVGIYKNIDRDAISSKHFASKNDFGTFVPRFARNENNLMHYISKMNVITRELIICVIERWKLNENICIRRIQHRARCLHIRRY